jgi:large subunit ribosomal protein L21
MSLALSFRLKGLKRFFYFFLASKEGFSFKIFEYCLIFLDSFFTFAVQFSKAMYAIVEIAGKQFKVAKDQYIYAPKLEGEAGTAVSFDKVLLIDNGGSVDIGAPTVSGASVSGKILEHVKGNKVIVFKKKRRKGYAVKNGHRQQFTKVQIESIG